MVDQSTMEACLQLVREVGVFQMKHFRSMPDTGGPESGGTMGRMKAVRETVSFVDEESESMLFQGLGRIVPEAGFFGEETGRSGSRECFWVVDPLDGTTNYLSGLDHFSISVALIRENEPVLGLVYKPSTDEVFSAMAGQGAYWNGEASTRFVDVFPAEEALFMTGFPYRSPDVSSCFFDAAAKVLTTGRGIRRSGSAALDLATLSMGWIQGFWETDLQPYDCAAAMVLMRENGVIVSNQSGSPYDLWNDRLMVAALPGVHEKLLGIVADSYQL
ncbi:inositol monophosphatase family protein [Oceaniferula marina]|nr:inositol monophosphatase [Oceaniferula marina]